MIILITTALIDFIICTALIGISVCALIKQNRVGISKQVLFGIMVLSNIFIELYWWPAISYLDISFVIHNEAAAQFLDYKTGSDLFKIDLFSFVLWFISGSASYFIGTRLLKLNAT